ncbi:hypothetical protein PUNSTDRAFT_77194 [Punctularia strigosozonata HHB-11173 SS5]|uniref:Asl1-like glycosyl hydrolase catalytic domain-containing protein n=1 Tax=Punctularia strigosozonata (strain HHB-11173) TaxID=741275 RepID=R7S3Z8_PUNST|nr:uncharacterized protein PUNSTDRAFT_77194 [Punctularia strigosozonata HHB-11173 SS5]EIN03961.1 hypothetical protein PUNSTDRAFT_77194 [Punctularia strigosozonata HHB-11173 SS5]
MNVCRVSWAYNWDSTKSGSLASGVEYVPMLWGTSSDHTSAWTTHANAAISSGSTHLLGFNEPDLSSQSNLSPSAAAAAWKTYMEPFAGKAKLVSPAITNGAAPMGTAWLDDFLSACSGCTIDAIAIHIYDAASNTAYFQNYISDIGTKYGKPVWVTEFGATGSTSDQQTFLETMLPFLDGLSSVERYSYFGDFSGTFVDSSNKLLALGETYASA